MLSSAAEGDLYKNEMNAAIDGGGGCMACARKHIGTELIWMT